MLMGCRWIVAISFMYTYTCTCKQGLPDYNRAGRRGGLASPEARGRRKRRRVGGRAGSGGEPRSCVFRGFQCVCNGMDPPSTFLFIGHL